MAGRRSGLLLAVGKPLSTLSSILAPPDVETGNARFRSIDMCGGFFRAPQRAR